MLTLHSDLTIMQLDFEIDKLTHSLEDAKTGEILSTDVLLLSKPDLKGITGKNGWKFNWKMDCVNNPK